MWELQKRVRSDGRSATDIRPIQSICGLLPRTHGSALFTRGETQVLGVYCVKFVYLIASSSPDELLHSFCKSILVSSLYSLLVMSLLYIFSIDTIMNFCRRTCFHPFVPAPVSCTANSGLCSGFVFALRKILTRALSFTVILQALAVVTLGGDDMGQRIDNLTNTEDLKRFYLQVGRPLFAAITMNSKNPMVWV